ncbi:MAG: sigma-70 family RNA polymerase sigma factor [Myxococcaceae bacterium]|jgi:RNA polymerase sigma-70 factor (ECF subfamily)|nr:sigma-70 family RNA polymerase sigma factor [Myxococcaceae bacterium]
MTVGALAWEEASSMADDAGSDEALMVRFRGGDRQAFDELFRRHAAPLTSYLTRLTGSAAAAEDAVQLTFLSVIRSRDQFLSGSRVKPWLYAIASNAARDRHRRTRRESSGPDDAVEAGLDAVHGDAGLRRRLLEALQRLPEPQREAVILHRLEGWSFAEIAEAVGASETAVKVRAFRGTQVLREELKDVWEFES